MAFGFEMTDSSANNGNPRLTFTAGLLVTIVGYSVLCGGLVAVVFFVLPALGIDPRQGYSWESQPLQTSLFVFSVVLLIAVLGYASGFLAGLIGSWLYGWVSFDQLSSGSFLFLG
jgi:hypothetical protein